MAASEQWGAFLQQCLMHRIDAAEFKNLSKLLSKRHPIAQSALVDVLLETRLATGVKWDPLLPLYIDCLCKMGTVHISTVLASLWKHSSIRETASPTEAETPQAKKNPKIYTLMTDIRVIQDAMLAVSTGHAPKTFAEAIAIYSAIVDWIQAVVAWHNRQMNANEQTGGLMSSPDAVSVFESLGILLAALSGTGKGLEVLSMDSYEALKVKLGQALSAYLPLCVDVSLPLRNRLDALQKEFNLYGQPPSKVLEASSLENLNVNAIQFEASIIDGPVINSRAGLYIYIDAMLAGRPLVDDSMLFNYLTNRYGAHYEIMVQEMITAAFDVCSNGMHHDESSQTMFLFRSFLVNKLPSFFAAMLAASMVSLPMELCISHALSRLDPNTFPPFPQTFPMQESPPPLSVRQEFLFACAAHRLVSESSLGRLLGENPMQTLPVGYNKDEIVSRISTSPERAEQLINEIEFTQGNAGAIVGAITEVIHTLCNQKETMTLKNICNSLSRRPQALDVILLFRSPKQILQPLCGLLDSWHWDEDQGENQPVYDEFGSILLLVLAFKYRYDLRPYDLGIASNDSFVLRLLDRGASSQKLDDLNEKQNKHLGTWIGALFIAEGITEETMSACSPQEFYILASTLFSQSLGACEAGKLEFDTLKGGFEYLLEPFLLPSLVVALTWLGNHIWETESDPSIPLKALHSLVSPGSISGEAKEIHRTVLNITARSLEDQLEDVRARHPARTDIKPVLDALEPCLSFPRTGSCLRSELKSWAPKSSGGLLSSIRNTIRALCMWCTRPDVNLSPPLYTHRQIVQGVRMLGATRVLAAILDELKMQSDANNGDLVLDIAASLVCAPLPESFAVEQNTFHPVNGSDPTGGGAKDPLPRCPILTLRDALALQHENLPRLAERDPSRAELIVRLYRRVNVLIAPTAQVPNLDMSNIIQNIQLGVEPHDQMNLAPPGGADGDDDAHLDQMLNNAAAAAAAGIDSGVGVGVGVEQSLSEGMETIDDVLHAADMAVGNPEFLDLDMEGMF